MATKENTYVEAVGRRKTATARVRIMQSKKETFTVNEKTLDEYFAVVEVQQMARMALSDAPEKFAVSAIVKGGGTKAQAEAIRHGIARALTEFEPNLRKDLKHKGFLKRDPRMKERKKFGLKKARKSPQWSKR